MKPDAIVLDNVVMFPAIANAGVPWVRVVSCAETEIPGRRVPPYLSGLRRSATGMAALRGRYLRAVGPAHKRMNAFLADAA